jgi:quercetin dioxygenase-like cupin family protein
MSFSKGLVKFGESFMDQKWSILGEPYRPIQLTPTSLIMYSEFSAGGFVPMHIHETQDEALYILEGDMEFETEGKVIKAGPGDIVCLPMAIPHALFNRSDKVVKSLVVVSPTGKFYDYMKAIDGLTDPAEVVRLGPSHEIQFV